MVRHILTLVMFLSATLFIAGCDDAATRPADRPAPSTEGPSREEDPAEMDEREKNLRESEKSPAK